MVAWSTAAEGWGYGQAFRFECTKEQERDGKE